MDVIDHQQTELQAQNDDSSLFSIPPIIANRCLKDFYIARDTKDTYEWFISEKLKISLSRKIRYEIGESGKQNRAGRMPEKYS